VKLFPEYLQPFFGQRIADQNLEAHAKTHTLCTPHLLSLVLLLHTPPGRVFSGTPDGSAADDNLLST
jgi:hypothetical protein